MIANKEKSGVTMKNNLTLVIMAAGMGSRYGGTKQIDGVGPNNETLMDYSIYDSYQCGIRHVILVIRQDFEEHIKVEMQEKWKDYSELTFTFVNQEINHLPPQFTTPEDRTKPWGTTHVLYILQNFIDSPFIILNADDFYGSQAFQSLCQFFESHQSHALVSYPLGQTLSPYGGVTRGLCRKKDGKLTEISETENITPGMMDDSLPVSMNMWGFLPSIFKDIQSDFSNFLTTSISDPKKERLIPQTIQTLLKNNKISITLLESGMEWFGMTYQRDKEDVKEKLLSLIARGDYPKNIFKKENYLK